MKRKLGIILLGFLLVCSSSTTSYADVKEGICKDTASEKILEERVLNLEDLIEKYSQSDTKDKLDDLKDEIKDEKKELRNVKVEKDAKKVIKNIKSAYSNINSAIRNKKSFLKSGKEKKEEKASKYIASTENIIESIQIDLLNYKVALVDNVNIGDVIRETLHIVVEGDYTLELLNAIAEKEALAYVEQNKVNALAVGFYEDEKNIGKGYDMGRVEYVPYGDWARAMDVKAGDYSDFEFVNYLEESISSSLPKGTPITEDKGETDINLVKSDIEGVYEGLDVNVTKKDGILVVNVVETQDAILQASELTISAYTDWCLDNIKSDIKSIDFTVETNNGTVRALLDTNKIETSNGRYFDSSYIAENIQ